MEADSSCGRSETQEDTNLGNTPERGQSSASPECETASNQVYIIQRQNHANQADSIYQEGCRGENIR